MSKTTEAILFHTKIYVLGDRFNITKLKDLTFCHITSVFKEFGEIATTSDADGIMKAVAYAYNTLPFSVQQACSLLSSSDVEEKLLVYMAEYTAWARDSLRMNETFLGLLEDCSEFALALIFSLKKPIAPPWDVNVVHSDR